MRGAQACGVYSKQGIGNHPPYIHWPSRIRIITRFAEFLGYPTRGFKTTRKYNVVGYLAEMLHLLYALIEPFDAVFFLVLRDHAWATTKSNENDAIECLQRPRIQRKVHGTFDVDGSSLSAERKHNHDKQFIKNPTVGISSISTYNISYAYAPKLVGLAVSFLTFGANSRHGGILCFGRFLYRFS